MTTAYEEREEPDMQWVEVSDYGYPGGWVPGMDGVQRSREYCRRLEEGKVVYLPTIPFNLSQDDRDFLLSQKQSAFKGHKNISYRPASDLLRGADSESPDAAKRLHEVMRDFSKNVTSFLSTFL